jgi:hypothetical protein
MAIKHLTLNNWDQPDDTSSIFSQVSPLGGVTKIDGSGWARIFLAVEVSDAVPLEVGELFAVARGMLVYGWFYYPLYALGEEQLHRVADSAVAYRYKELCGPLTKRGYMPSLATRIRWLTHQGIIPAAMTTRWDAIRKLRNIGSHPNYQMLHPPGAVLETLRIVAQQVTALFANPRRHDA